MSRTKQVLRLGFSTRRYEIEAEDIRKGTFELLTNRRNIAQSVVNRIFENLMSGKHFDSSFVVNQRNSKFRLIDGNHRYEAIVKYLGANPENRVEVLLHIYEGLDDDAEKSLYTLYNLGRKQSTNDFIQQYKEEIPIWKIIINQTKFPVKVTVYGGIGSISFYKIVGAYVASLKPRFPGGYIGRPLDFVYEAKNLGHSDLNLMAEFMKEFLQAFGPIRNNVWLKTTPINAIMRIWMDNRDHIKPDVMVSLFRKKLANDALAVDLGKASGLGACKYARDKYLIMLNEGRSRELFVNKDTEYCEETEDDESQELTEETQDEIK